VKRVLVRGPLLSQSGYGEHCRQIFQFCETQKNWQVSAQITPWGITPWVINSEFEGGLYGRIMEKSSVPTDAKFDITFQVQLPNEWDPSVGKYNVGVTAGVETDRCSVEWATLHREKMDMMIVPSEFSKRAFLKSGTGREKTPIHVVPEAYYADLVNEPTSDVLENVTTSKNFLMVGALVSENPNADRKNLVNSINWFMHAFHNKKDVGLIVKTTKGRDTSIDREIIRKMMKQIRKSSGAGSFPKLYMLHGSMTRQEMTSLYKSEKICALASASRGEGFGLPMLEAAVCGLPVVATDWSAYTEFLSGPSFLRVKYDLKSLDPSRVDDRIFVKNAQWAEARPGNFKRKLKMALEQNDMLKEKAQSLSKKLLETHSLKRLFDEYRSILSEVM